MTGRRRGSSIGQLDVGDTQGSSMSSAAIHNETRARRRTAARSSKSSADAPSTRQRSIKRGSALRKVFSTTWVFPFAILAAFYATWFFVARDDPDHWMNAFVKLSYNVPGTNLYGKGKRDWAFLALHVVFFTWLREFFMQAALRPMAYVLGLRSKHKVNRFLEQAYSLIYYGVTGPVGLYIMYKRCPELWFFNTRAFYEDFPHRVIDGWFKAFYLLQAAFWAQQALILMLHLEKRRRDFEELVFHHIVTVALIWLSYRFHFTNIGLAVYITMDVSDFFLALSKILNYLDLRDLIQVPIFATFVGVWIYLRHYLNIKILWSVLTEFRTVGPWELNWETQQYKCYISQPITFGLLFLLQLVNLYWLALVLRIGWRYVRHNVKEDVRSEGEEEEGEVASIDNVDVAEEAQ